MQRVRGVPFLLSVLTCLCTFACTDSIDGPSRRVIEPRRMVSCYTPDNCAATDDGYVPQTHDEMLSTFGDGLFYQFDVPVSRPIYDPAAYGNPNGGYLGSARGCIDFADFGFANGLARWVAPDGEAVYFAAEPPFYFVQYMNRLPYKGMYWAVYSTPTTVTADDPSTGDVYQWSGQFSALCTTAVKVPNGQIGYVYAREVITTPTLVSRGSSGGGGGGSSCDTQIIYDPSQPCTGGGGGGGGSGSGGTGGSGGSSCTSEYVIIEVSNDGGATWTTWWEGYANVCS